MNGQVGGISNTIIDEVRERVDIVSLVSEYVSLKKSGQNYLGRCPFHDEKTPSFSVSPAKNMFYCFGCGEGGNVFTFLIKHEGMTFGDALKYLAARAGVELPKPSSKKTGADDGSERRIERLREVLEFAHREYQHNLFKSGTGDIALKYLKNRGVSEQTIRDFGIGFAADAWEGLVEVIRKKGLSLQAASEAGLITSKGKDTGYYDRFRNRVIFPIHNASGNVIAFAGRALIDDPKQAKYINSPETPLYQKSRVLYGLNLAKNHIRKHGSVVLVEGYFDQISLFNGGIRNVVATCGTALTKDHINILYRYSKNIYTLFDPDESGRKAALRALPLLLAERAVPMMVSIEGGDPDDYIRKHGPESMQAAITHAKPMMEVFVDDELDKAGASMESRSEAAKTIAEMLAMMKDSVLRDVYLKDFAQRIGISETLFRSMARRHSQTQKRTVEPEQPEKNGSPRKPAATSPERTLIELIAHYPNLRARFVESKIIDEFSSSFAKELAGYIAPLKEEKEDINMDGFLEMGKYHSHDQAFVARLAVEDRCSIEAERAPRALEDCIETMIRAKQDSFAKKTQVDLQKSVEKGDEDQELEQLKKIVALRGNKA